MRVAIGAEFSGEVPDLVEAPAVALLTGKLLAATQQRLGR